MADKCYFLSILSTQSHSSVPAIGFQRGKTESISLLIDVFAHTKECVSVLQRNKVDFKHLGDQFSAINTKTKLTVFHWEEKYGCCTLVHRWFDNFHRQKILNLCLFSFSGFLPFHIRRGLKRLCFGSKIKLNFGHISGSKYSGPHLFVFSKHGWDFFSSILQNVMLSVISVDPFVVLTQVFSL